MLTNRKRNKPTSKVRRFRNDIRAKQWKGRPGFWHLVRRLLWSWWLWGFIAALGIYTGNTKATVIGGIVAVFTYLVTPQEQSPRYGLDNKFSVESPNFLGSMVGATGVPFVEGNSIRILNNGDAFYPD